MLPGIRHALPRMCTTLAPQVLGLALVVACAIVCTSACTNDSTLFATQPFDDPKVVSEPENLPAEEPQAPSPEMEEPEPVVAPEPVAEPVVSPEMGPCIHGQTRCISTDQLEICLDGNWETRPCVLDGVCLPQPDGSAQCLLPTCEPNAIVNCHTQFQAEICDATGTQTRLTFCPDGTFCAERDGNYLCTDQVCAPGSLRCSSAQSFDICTDDGQGYRAFGTCRGDTQCSDGECLTPCELSRKDASFLGCQYWSADLDNITGGQDAAHAVIISNPHPSRSAEITVYNSFGEPVLAEGWVTEIGPGEQATWRFEDMATNTLTGEDLLDTSLVDGTVLVEQTFQFISTLPVSAHQFNPLVDTNVHTNDASLLLPTEALGTEYLVMSWQHRSRIVDLRGYIAIIATGVEPTTIQIKPKTHVLAGHDHARNMPLDRLDAQMTHEFVLQPGQLLNLETEGPVGDFTGTEILSDQPIVVFGGHECANVPENWDACDHLEQQLFPVSSWGTRYVGTALVERDFGQNEFWRFLASENDTQIMTDPPIAGVHGATLQRGQFIEVETHENFLLTATKPVLPAQYITGAAYRGSGNTGDPAMALAVPVEQWRRDYIVLTPPAYNVGDYLNIVSPVGIDVFLDDEPIVPDVFFPVGNSEYRVARIPVADGVHRLRSDEPFMVMAYGYDLDVSYAYPGGLNLERLYQDN